MNRFDRLIAYFAPRAAAERARARVAIEAYAAAKDTRLRNIKRTSSGPNATVRSDAVTLRRMARQFDEDSDLAKRALDLLVQNVIGPGITPEPTARTADGTAAVDFNEAVARRLRDWRRRPEVTRRFSDAAAKRLAFRSLMRDGEVLIQHVRGSAPGLTHSTALPYSYELIDADRLPMDYDNQVGRISAGGTIVQGIALNDWNEPQAYFLNPYLVDDRRSLGSLNTSTPIRKDAADILHAALISRIGQLRGVSQFATVMSRLEDMNEVDEAERIAVRIAASIGLAIYSSKNQKPAVDADDDTRTFEFQPGFVLSLDPDDKAEMLESKRPTESLMPWRKSQSQAFAGGVNVGYSSLMMDYLGTYSSQRQELVEAFASFGVIWSHWVDTVEEPMYRETLKLLIATDADIRTLSRELDERTIYDAEFSRPVMPWVDPVKEAESLQLQYDLGIKTKASMIRERGGNPEETTEAVAEEKRAAAKLALETAPPAPAAAVPTDGAPQKPTPKGKAAA